MSRMWKLLAICTVALGIAAVPAAHAAPFGSEEEAVFAYAAEYWGRAPALCTSITKEVVPPSELAYTTASGLTDIASGQATRPTTLPVPCFIAINELLRGTGLCVVVLHEYGHLLGYAHEDPAFGGDSVFADSPGCTALSAQEDRASRWDFWREVRSECQAKKAQARRRCARTLRRWSVRLKSGAARAQLPASLENKYAGR